MDQLFAVSGPGGGGCGRVHRLLQEFPTVVGFKTLRDILSEKMAKWIVQADGLVDFRTSAGSVGANVDEILIFAIRRKHFTSFRRERLLIGVS
jgi:hypothetical protein